jgi:hypothetical protein
MKLVLARHWLSHIAILGREAAMRVLGTRSLSGQIPAGAEDAYDQFFPIYDPDLELHMPIERPPEFIAMEWSLLEKQKDAWLKGEHADNWTDYPESIQGFQIIGERTWFIRPEWEWPREERHRGLVAGTLPASVERQILSARRELTYQAYLGGHEQDDRQLIVLNPESQLAGSAYMWAAINSNFAHALGWSPSDNVPFEWLNSSGAVMVKSVYWKNGWIWLEPPRFESLGEGWLVLASPHALEAIRSCVERAELHLWVERHSHGHEKFNRKWHLSKPI